VISVVADLRCIAEFFKNNINKDVAPLDSWRVWLKMVHAFPLLLSLFPEVKQALTEICKFINIQFERGSLNE